MAPDTEGRRAFEAWHQKQREAGRNKRELAKLFGVSSQAVDQWIGRGSRPDFSTRERIAAVASDVSVSSWDTDAELRARAENIDESRRLAAALVEKNVA